MTQRHLGLALFCALLVPTLAHAQGGAPGLYGVREVMIDDARFDDAKASERCGLSRDVIADVLAKAFADTTVPAIQANKAKPLTLGVARVELIPQISSFNDDSLDCMSWISLTVQSKADIVVPPILATREVTVTYWQQHVSIFSGQSIHTRRVTEGLQQMAAQFAQQYKSDQPAAPAQ